MQRLKAKPNQKYGKYTAIKTENRCEGCVAEHDPALCNDMPICSSDSESVIFKIDNE